MEIEIEIEIERERVRNGDVVVQGGAGHGMAVRYRLPR